HHHHLALPAQVIHIGLSYRLAGADNSRYHSLGHFKRFFRISLAIRRANTLPVRFSYLRSAIGHRLHRSLHPQDITESIPSILTLEWQLPSPSCGSFATLCESTIPCLQ